MATVIELDGKTPRVADDAYVAPTAVLIGDVTVSAGASIWFGAVLRGDNSSIVIGEGSNVQDNCVIHCADELPTIVGANVTVGHMAMLEGCRIGDGSLIGMGAVVMNGARIGAGSLVAAGAVVLEGTEVPPGSLVAGLPAKVRRELSEDEAAGVPMMSVRSGKVLRSVTIAPAPTRQCLPITAPFITTAWMPISEPSPIVQPCSMTWWPTVTLAPIVKG